MTAAIPRGTPDVRSDNADPLGHSFGECKAGCPFCAAEAAIANGEVCFGCNHPHKPGEPCTSKTYFTKKPCECPGR